MFISYLKIVEDSDNSCCTSGFRRVTLLTNLVISHQLGLDGEVFTTGGTYPWSFVTQVFHSSQPSHVECVYGEKGATSSSKDLIRSSNFEIMSKIEERHNQKKIKQQRSTKNYTKD
jgi:hypothetical protein